MGAIILLIATTAFASLLVFITSFLGPKSKRLKNLPYECGVAVEESKGGKTKISLRFYLAALLFIIFDVEILFLFPWALTYKDFVSQGLGWFSFLSMLIFMIFVVLSLIWDLKEGSLDWN